MTLDAMQSFDYRAAAVIITVAVLGVCGGVKALARHILKKQAKKQRQERKQES